LQVREFPYEFRTRQHGESKLDIVVAFEYLYLLADKIFGRFVPVRFVLYILAGLSGLLLHLAVLGALHRLAEWPFVTAQIAATIQEKAFDDLDAPVQRVCSLDAPAIYSPALENLQLPTVARIIEKVLHIR
jgi:hypothetical protein